VDQKDEEDSTLVDSKILPTRLPPDSAVISQYGKVTQQTLALRQSHI